jgi:Spy/CpxP family protein refolding chaperone
VKLTWKNLSIATIAGMLIMTAAAAVAFSQGPQGPQGPPPGGGFRGGPGPRDGLGPLGHELNLTDDQKAQIKKISESFAESDKAFHDQLRALHTSEPDPMNGAFDEAAVRAAAEARAKIQIELEVSHAKMMSQISSVLTAEQKTQLAAKRQQFERMGPPPPPPGRAPQQP